VSLLQEAFIKTKVDRKNPAITSTIGFVIIKVDISKTNINKNVLPPKVYLYINNPARGKSPVRLANTGKRDNFNPNFLWKHEIEII